MQADMGADVVAVGRVEDGVELGVVSRWGQLDVLVNNAGATRMMPLAETTAEGIAGLFDLNVTAPSLLARAALPHLRDTKGAIVNVSSTYGHRPLPGAAHYAASKAALEQLTRSWALELADAGRRPASRWPAAATPPRWPPGSSGWPTRPAPG